MPFKPPTFRPPMLKGPPRPSPSARGYDADWQRFRTWYAGQVPAICVHCTAALPSEQMHLDHKIRLEDGGPRLDVTNVQWLCETCHGRKTASESRGNTA